jgi:RimJ/RimL family protein N-acetyltransferase
VTAFATDGATDGDIRLEPLTNAHLPGIVELVGDADVIRFTRIPDPVPAGWVDAWIRRYEDGRADGTRDCFAIVDRDGAFLGFAAAPEIDAGARTAELGYVVAPPARGRGVATRALELLTRWAFDDAGILRAELLISTENVASKRVAEKDGYRYEGTLRSVHFKGDLREDTEIWSRLPSDPAPEL